MECDAAATKPRVVVPARWAGALLAQDGTTAGIAVGTRPAGPADLSVDPLATRLLSGAAAAADTTCDVIPVIPS